MRKILSWFGLGIRYRDHRGTFSHRYNGLDFNTSRPLHDQMSVAYPSARLEIYKLS